MSFDMSKTPPARKRTVLNRNNKKDIPSEKVVKEDIYVASQNEESLIPDVEKDISFLQQDMKTLVEAEEKAPHSIPLWENDAKIKTLQTLNVLRMLAPAINKAMCASNDQQEQAALFTTLVKNARKLSFKTGVILGADAESKKDRWVFSVLDRLFTESIPAFSDFPEEHIIDLAHIIVNVAEEGSVEKKDFILFETDIAIKIALMKAMTPVLIAQTNFDFNRNVEDDIINMSELIFNTSAKALIELVDPFAKESERVVLFQILTDISGAALAEFWNLVSNNFKEELRSKTPLEIEHLENAFPNGYSITEILEKHESFMRRLTGLAKNLKLPAKKKY